MGRTLLRKHVVELTGVEQETEVGRPRGRDRRREAEATASRKRLIREGDWKISSALPARKEH